MKGWRLWLVGALIVLTVPVLGIWEALDLRSLASGLIDKTLVPASTTGILEKRWIKIGGIKQWITIRGRDRGNPVLLFLHGGPGSSMIPQSWLYESAWEDYFTVVQWDQRGAGKTYATDPLATRGMTFELMLSDAAEVIDYLRHSTKQDKIFLVGHSWGSMLGLTLAKRHPDWLWAYVGMGQAIDMPENEAASYQGVLAEARTNGNTQAVADLEGLAPYPGEGVPPIAKLRVERQWAYRLGNVWGGQTQPGFEIFFGLLSPETSPWDLLKDSSAEIIGSPLMREMFESIDMRKNGYDYQVPIFFFAGTEDLGTPGAVAKAYFDRISAPVKQFYWFPGAGHFVMLERPGSTLVHLVSDVLPVAHRDLPPSQ